MNIPVLITDQKSMFGLMLQNIALNNLATRVMPVVYNWGSPIPTEVSETLQNHGRTRPELILAADCVYFEPAFPLLLQTLHDLIGLETTCYFCFKKRRKADWRFIKQIHRQFAVQPVNYEEKPSDQRQGIYLYALKMRNHG